MEGFIRVRSTQGPKAEYEVSEAAFKARPEAFVRVGSGSKPDVKPTPVARAGADAPEKEAKK
ncbi:hypothetical protein EDF60_1689 [Leucobacter luti]|uniref:hypothetical protein n=1 Tax=Leucobacter luti TaxID=340320 RepID=UPI0010D0F677|nr:hypothetical protein [Leucobacter luti]MCW2287038.1 hypothetical protein [Leucobacter luti]TCK41263.1 hypothetical protein EDF60_1689 [Leucobacter luti]